MPPRPLCIATSQEALDARESYTVEAGTFEKDNMKIGPDGVAGAGGQYTLADFTLGEILGKVARFPAQPPASPAWVPSACCEILVIAGVHTQCQWRLSEARRGWQGASCVCRKAIHNATGMRVHPACVCDVDF